MYKVLIDTTQRNAKKVSLVDMRDIKDKEDKKEEKIVSQREGNIDIVSSIREILKENSLDLSDIDEFIPNTGPGSFTGIKVGVTIANVLNWILGKKSITNLYIPEYGKEPNITLSRPIV